MFLKDLMQKQYPNISKSDKLLLVAGEDVIIKCIYFRIKRITLKVDVTLHDIYEKKFEDDGWLYLKLSIEK